MDKFSRTCTLVRVLAAKATKLTDVNDQTSGYDSFIGIGQRYDRFSQMTAGLPNLAMTYSQFRSRVPIYEKFLNESKNMPNYNKNKEKSILMQHFGVTALKTNVSDIENHTIQNCRICEMKIKKLFGKPAKKSEMAQETVRKALATIDEKQFNNAYNITIKDAIAKALCLVPKETVTCIKKQAANDIKSAITRTQTIQTENNDDLANVLKTGMSFASYDRQRLNREFREDQQELETIVENQEKSFRNPLTNFENYSFPQKEFIAYLEAEKPKTINWSELARTVYKVTFKGKEIKNAGQVLFNFAKHNGIDVNNINNH